MMKALVKPSSRFKVQDLAGLQTPETGAYPEGPPMSKRVSHIAMSWLSFDKDKSFRFHLLTFSNDLLEFPSWTYEWNTNIVRILYYRSYIHTYIYTCTYTHTHTISILRIYKVEELFKFKWSYQTVFFFCVKDYTSNDENHIRVERRISKNGTDLKKYVPFRNIERLYCWRVYFWIISRRSK